MKDLTCPYCGHEQDVNHDDGFGYEEDEAHQVECAECEKKFIFHTHISFSYHESKANCLNGGPHDFTEWSEHHLIGTELAHKTRRCRACEKYEQVKIQAT